MSLVSFATKTPFVKRIATFCKNNKKLLVGTGLGLGTLGLIGIGAKKTEKENIDAIAINKSILSTPMCNPFGWMLVQAIDRQANQVPDGAKNVYVA